MGYAVHGATLTSGRHGAIPYLVLNGSRKWVIGRNATMNFNNLYFRKMYCNSKVLSKFDSFFSVQCKILNSLTTKAFYTPADNGSKNCHLMPASTVSMSEKTSLKTENIFDTVHKQNCGHTKFKDIKLLPNGNELDNIPVSEHVHMLVKD